MTARTPSEARTLIETTNLDRYGYGAIPWSRPRDLLDQGALGKDTLVVLGTCRPNCAPHAAGIGAAWSEGDLYFTSSPAARKARNLAANPACTISRPSAGDRPCSRGRGHAQDRQGDPGPRREDLQ